MRKPSGFQAISWYGRISRCRPPAPQLTEVTMILLVAAIIGGRVFALLVRVSKTQAIDADA
jgi:hypothetical protein